ncbi:methionine synthase [Allomeiothermus silvanus]|uniref:methionine synthase n=1 Tax=Allomeiothermus silvanus TaxID=52022 RepID=UPI000325E9C4|nr:methionine synthase [Allomeiothermus silvanus]
MPSTSADHICGPGCHHPQGQGWGVEPLTHLGYQREARAEAFPYLRALSERVLIYDGAMGTEIFKYDLSAADYGAEQYNGCPEMLNRTRPDVIEAIHKSYLEAGADVIETNTFGAFPHVLVEYGLEAEAYELAFAGAHLARRVADEHSTPDQPRFVAGSMGPGTKLISLGQISWEGLFESYRVCAQGLLDGGVDLILIETCQDILQVRCAVLAARRAMKDVGREVPIQVQVTMETTGTMLVGTDDAAALTVLEALPIDVVGFNCATGPDLMDTHVRFFCENATRWVSCLPNAGLPRNEGGRVVYDLTPAELARWQQKFVNEYGLNVVGGCCGTGPEHIRALAQALRRQPQKANRQGQFPAQVASLYQAIPLKQDTGILIVGERTNATGSKKFRELLFAEDWEGMLELAQEQVAEGAHVLDVSVAWTGRDEVRDMREVVKRFATSVQIPIMIDSTQTDVMQAALEHLGGRAILNSVNLEDGLEKFDRVASLARQHGAALVALTIDEDKEAGMAKTPERKVEIALRMYERLTQVHGIPGSSILFDLLTFPITQGDEDTRKLAMWTIEGIRRVRELLPEVGFILGISNVSFGLSPQARVVLNSVFLDECIKAGLTAAILNAGKIRPINQIPEEQYQLALDLIYDRRTFNPDGSVAHDPLFAFVDYFAKNKVERSSAADPFTGLSVEERLKKRIIEGRKVGLEADLESALQAGYTPVSLINEVLLEGMKVVGDLFGAGKMQLPFVLQAAETMKAAVRYLEPKMDRLEGVHKGTMVLATVKGDVHDIGKNLVDIILSNNGYKVVNLGIKKPIEEILAAVEEHRPQAVGMSGLLVKSTVVMKENLEYMRERGYRIPVILGGAALNRHYVENDLRQTYTTGTVYYASDAFDGLQLMDELCGHAPPKLTSRFQSGHKYKTAYEILMEKLEAGSEYVPSNIPPAARIPRPPFWGRQVVRSGVGKTLPQRAGRLETQGRFPSGRRSRTPGGELDLGVIAQYVNKNALFRGQWGFRRGEMDKAEYAHKLEREAEPIFRELLDQAMREGTLEPAVAYGFWPVASDKNKLVVFDPESGAELFAFDFPRQMGQNSRHLCIADFFRPRYADAVGDEESWIPRAAWENGARDVLGCQVVTMGRTASEYAAKLFSSDRYQDYLYWHGFSVEMAEALAEYWHKRVRQQLGIAQDDATDLQALFQQGYQGSRYSFGYPACPRLEDQRYLQDLLQWQEIGVELSEEFQLHPEQSTSAIVVHHPSAKYFNL